MLNSDNKQSKDHKLSLNKETMYLLSDNEMGSIKGGAFLSIGCSKRNSCTRALERGKCKNNG
ncbi:class I lanthipeptide, partial [Xanthovirga aplysinae]|uniref:class I lanthipeptide n=1 Tax=Xanthovirga aplysinae TaxID=2529853 RepID=UPI00165714A3